jgi:hypothetical protein
MNVRPLPSLLSGSSDAGARSTPPPVGEQQSARLLWLGSRRTSKHFRRTCPVLGLHQSEQHGPDRRRGRCCPEAAVRAVPWRLLLSCLLLGSPSQTVEGGRQVGAAGLLHRRGGRAALAVSVGVAVGVPLGKPRSHAGAPTRTAPSSLEERSRLLYRRRPEA